MAVSFQAEVDTTGETGPRLYIDGALVPLSHYRYEHAPEADTWTFVVPSPDGDRAELTALLDQMDPARLEEQALARIDVYEGQPAPITAAVLAVLREVLRDGT